MKILFCSSFIYHSSNGAAIFAQLLIQWAKKRNITLHIISDEKSNYPFIPLVYHNSLFQKVPLIRQYQRSYIFYKTIENVNKEEKYDLIFFNNVYESLHSARFIKHTPVIAFLHDENFMKDYKQNPSTKRKLYRNFMHRMEQKACMELQGIVTNSQHMKGNIETIYKIHPIKIDHLYFRSYDLNEIHSTKKKNNTKTILFIKHDYERGGLIELISAINLINQYKIQLIVIGPDKNTHKMLKNMYKKENIEIYEFQNRNEIQAHYKQADVFCVPAHSEAMGIANFEAMFYELPVVTTNIPVMKELNHNRDILSIAPLGNVDELASALIKAMNMEDQVQGRIRRAKRFVEEELMLQQVYKKLDLIIDRYKFPSA